MATVIERERSNDSRPVIVDRGDSGVGWAVALIIIIAALIVAGFVWARYRAPAAAPSNGGSNINVTIPPAGSDASGGAGAPAGGTVPAGDTSGAGGPAY